MENNHQKFIEEYNKLENLLHKLPNAPLDANIKWFEESLSDIKEKNKLYFCRVTRNYIQHNEDYRDFVNISQSEIDFLKNEYLKVFSKITKISDVMTPIKKIQIKDVNDLVLESIDLIISKNLSMLPIMDGGKIIGVITPLIALSIQKSASKKDKNKNFVDSKHIQIPKDSVKFIGESKLLEEAFNMFEETKHSKKPLEYLFVTDVGNSKGNILGVISRYDIYNL